MPDIRITNLCPRKTTGLLDRLEIDLKKAAGDEQLGLVADDFACHFFSSDQRTQSTGRVVMVEVIGLFKNPAKSGAVRTVLHRNALLGRLSLVLEAFVAEHAPATQQIHLFCHELADERDGVRIVNRAK